MFIFDTITKNDIVERMNYIFNNHESTINIFDDKSLNDNNSPFVLFLDLAPCFNIPKNKLFVRNNFIKELKTQLNANFYLTYVYKNIITKKITIDSDEIAYNAINNCVNELNYIIKNLLYIKQNILIVNLGRFIEYKYVFKILNNFYNQNKNLINIYNSHYSYFLDNINFKKNVNFIKDINRIKKKLIDLSVLE